MQRRSRLQFLFDIAHATFSQAGAPTPAQIDALRRTLSQVPLDELGLPPHLEAAAHLQEQAAAAEREGHGESSSSSRSSSPSLSDGTHALLGRLLEEEAAEAAAAQQQQQAQQQQAQQQQPQQQQPQARPPITYLLIYEDSRVSLGIFCLPARAKIPLHNHPGMTVLSRVLYGKMHVASYDWADGAAAAGADHGPASPSAQQQQQQQGRAEVPLPRPAQLVLDATLTCSEPPAVLFPTAGGNIHEFTALTDCAVLDLMSPPYSTEDGRDCTYYSVVPAEQAAHAAAAFGVPPPPPGLVLLDAFDPPSDFVINQGHYRGVQPRPKLLPPLQARPHSPTGSSDTTAAAAAAAAAQAGLAAAAARQPTSASPSPPSSSPLVSSPPISSPTSGATDATMLGSLLASSGPQSGVADCAASGWHGRC